MILTFLTSLIYLDMYFKSKVKKNPTLLHVPVRTNQYIGHLNCIKLFFLNTRISQLDICSTDIDLQKIIMELIGTCTKNTLADNGFDIYDLSYPNLDNYCIFIF